MPQSAGNWTAEMVRALPDDGKRYEVVNGELLVTPSPRGFHQHAVLEVAVVLRRYLRVQKTGHVLIAPSDVELDTRSLVQPDVFVYAGTERRWNSSPVPILLAVEVLSPSTARADRMIKRRRYQQAGIPEYWIVDVDAAVIERWRPGDDRPEILTDSLVWRMQGASDDLRIDLPTLFAAITEGP